MCALKLFGRKLAEINGGRNMNSMYIYSMGVDLNSFIRDPSLLANK